jgi:hypothetical protein
MLLLLLVVGHALLHNMVGYDGEMDCKKASQIFASACLPVFYATHCNYCCCYHHYCLSLI